MVIHFLKPSYRTNGTYLQVGPTLPVAAPSLGVLAGNLVQGGFTGWKTALVKLRAVLGHGEAVKGESTQML